MLWLKRVYRLFLNTDINWEYLYILRGIKNSKTQTEFDDFFIKYFHFYLRHSVYSQTKKIDRFNKLSFLKSNPFYQKHLTEERADKYSPSSCFYGNET